MRWEGRYRHRKCVLCQKEYAPTSSRQIYCKDCKAEGERIRHRIYHAAWKKSHPEAYVLWKEKTRKRSMRWYNSKTAELKEEILERTKQNRRIRRAKEKEKVLQILGGQCARCGYSDPRALCVDHINGDGYLEKARHYEYFKAIISDPEEAKNRYQILCCNCNRIKQHDNQEYPWKHRALVNGKGNHWGPVLRGECR
jgi:hypothetical protein